MRIEGLELNLGMQSAIQAISAIQGGNANDWIPGEMGVTGRTFGITSLPNGQAIDPSGHGRRFVRSRNGRTIDLHEVAKMLNISKNKLFVLRLLKRSDLISLLYLMPKNLLVNALRLFSKNKLLRLLMMLPKRLLLKMLLHLMSIEHLISKMPAREIFSILRSNKLTNRVLLQGFRQMDPKFLFAIMTKMLGFHDFSKMKFEEIMKVFMDQKKEIILESMKMLPYKALVPFVTLFAKQDPRLLENVSGEFIFKMFDKMSKPTLLQGCMALPDEVIIKFLGQLPDPLLLVAVSQIDDNTLEQYLLSKQSNLLALLGGAAA